MNDTCLHSNHPVSVPEDRYDCSVLLNTVNICALCPDHKIDMLHGVVGTARRKLFLAHGLAALDILGIRPAQRQVAGRVLIVQGIEEENTGF